MTLLELEAALKAAFIAADKLISAAHEAKQDAAQLRAVRGNISIATGALAQHIAAQPPVSVVPMPSAAPAPVAAPAASAPAPVAAPAAPAPTAPPPLPTPATNTAATPSPTPKA